MSLMHLFADSFAYIGSTSHSYFDAHKVIDYCEQ